MLVRPLLLFLLIISLPQTGHCQLLADTLFTWQGYYKPGICGLQLYKNPADNAKAYTVVLRELGDNPGAATTEDIGYLAEHIGRTYNIDPTTAYWIVHWGDFSYKGAHRSNKELFIRATFKRTSTQRMGAPQWRIVDREEIEKYTDRQFIDWNGL